VTGAVTASLFGQNPNSKFGESRSHAERRRVLSIAIAFPFSARESVAVETPVSQAAARTPSRARTPALLKGIIFGPTGTAMTPSHTRRNGKLYRYYVAMDVLKRGAAPGPVSRIPAGDVERIVVDQLRAILRAPEIVLRTWRKARQKIDNLTETEVREAIEQLYPLWDELFPAEQARILELFVERVDVQEDAVEIRFRVDGLRTLVEDFKGQEAA
jgi:site-specific DNA recombinase